jgi:hypothetical protein
MDSPSQAREAIGNHHNSVKYTKQVPTAKLDTVTEPLIAHSSPQFPIKFKYKDTSLPILCLSRSHSN